MSEKGFDASKYLVKLRGKEYLEVKWRLLWLRTQEPNAVIETEMVSHDPQRQLAVFKARVQIPNGGSATGWGSETSEDFGDYLEKAETKALGRALAALGFGTQFTEDFEFGAEQERVVDTPAARPAAPTPRGGHLLDEALQQGAQPANLQTAAAAQQQRQQREQGQGQGQERQGVITREEYLRQRANGRS